MSAENLATKSSPAASLEQLNATSWKLNGQVSFNSAAHLAAQLQQDKAAPKLTLDLSAASGGSALLLVLVQCWRFCTEQGQELQLLNPTPDLYKMAQLSNLHQLLPFG